MRKTFFAYMQKQRRKSAAGLNAKNRGADQLRGNCTADGCLCFCYIDRTRNPEERFSHKAAQMLFQV